MRTPTARMLRQNGAVARATSVLLQHAYPILRSPLGRALTLLHCCCCFCPNDHSRQRWCLTGTPVQNKPDDIQALFSFLRCAPLDDFGTWDRAIARPIRNGDDTGLSRLRVLTKAMALRRTKQVLSDKLPPKTVEVHTVNMPAGGVDLDVYQALFDSARRAFVATLEAGGRDAILQNYSSVLEVLLRLRQACCSQSLIPPARIAAARHVLETCVLQLCFFRPFLPICRFLVRSWPTNVV